MASKGTPSSHLDPSPKRVRGGAEYKDYAMASDGKKGFYCGYQFK